MDYTISKAIYNKIRGLRFLRTLLVGSSIILIALYVISLSVLSWFPIYPDEIAIRIFLTRLFEDFPLIRNNSLSCESFTQSRALIWYFPGLVEWLIHGQSSNLRVLRFIGLGFSAGIIAVLTFRLLTGKKHQFSNQLSMGRFYWTLVCLGLVISLLSIGVLPIFLILNRHEQLIIPCLIALLFIYPIEIDNERKLGLRITSIIVFFISTSVMLYSHPKALLFTPLIFSVGYRLFFTLKNKWLSVGLIVVLIYESIANFIAHTALYQCNANPAFKHYLEGMSLGYKDIFYNTPHFFRQIIQSLRGVPEYFNKIGFQSSTEVGYLPSLMLSPVYKIANLLIDVNLSMLFITLGILLPFLYCKDFFAKKYFSLNLILLVLFISICGAALCNLTKHWYDVDFFWTVLIIIFVFFIKDHLQYLLKNRFSYVGMLYLICSSIFSLSLFLFAYTPSIKSGYSGPGTSLRDYKYIELASMIKKSVTRCHIDLLSSENLIVDDLTYTYFRTSKSPILITYIALNYWAAKPNNLLRENIRHSSGLVTRCSTIARSARQYGNDNGLICCASKKLVEKIIQKEYGDRVW